MKAMHWMVALGAISLAACSDGPAENAGEEADAAIEEVTGEETTMMEDAGEAMDEMADDVDDAVEDATDEPQ